tara:strand:- start:43 stop:438 length:396 start_codon:yes stop_codon:yes gene_type:complete
MRKYILTVGIALLSLGASAQYMVTTTVNQPAEGESWSTAHFTDNMGIGYMYKSIVAGVVKNGEDYDIFGRYCINDNVYVAGQMATDSTHNLSIGIGYSVSLWKGLYVEPYYIKELDSDEEGSFKLGLTYKL